MDFKCGVLEVFRVNLFAPIDRFQQGVRFLDVLTTEDLLVEHT